MTTLDRYRGCLLGLAAGDALGTTVEFRAPGSFAPLTDMIGGGPFHLQAGQWTDDTSMALCLAESLVHCQGFDAKDQMERYVRWWQDGYLSSIGECFDIGGTTFRALSRFVADAEPLAGTPDPEQAGNGSLMRLAPVPMAFARHLALAQAYAELSSCTTHGAATCRDACHFYGGLISMALGGADKAELLHATPTRAYCPEVAAVAAGSFLTREPPQIRGSGYVVAALEAALWAFARSTDFRHGALLAVNLGDDADTTGAIYGQLAGAHYGISGIPSAWHQRLAMLPLVEQLAEKLADFAATLDAVAHTTRLREVQRQADVDAHHQGTKPPRKS